MPAYSVFPRYLWHVRGRADIWFGASLVGAIAAGISILRVVVVNPQALQNLVWAEDGIFPLCVDKEGPLTCTVDAYAGYLILLPRLLAIPISGLPLESWAWATNLVAALAAGVLCAIAMGSLRSWGLSRVPAAFISLLPVAAPIVGLEAINVYSSVYMLLLFTMTIVLATWTPDRSPWWAALGVLVTALTIPSAIVLALPLVLLAVNRRIKLTQWAPLFVALLVGMCAQLAVALNAAIPRPVSVSWNSINAWVENIPVALLTLWPGMSFGPTTIFGIFETPTQWWSGWLILALLVGLALLGVSRGDRVSWAAGVLTISGLAIGAIPTVIGYVSVRYYVAPVLLITASAVLMVTRIRWRNPGVAALTGLAVVIFLWWPAFPASSWRATATPSWLTEVDRIRGACAVDVAATVDVLFSPDWPMPQVELSEPTTARAKCIEVANR